MDDRERPAKSLLLLSGGHDSIALAAWLRPDACLTIDYGQRPVQGEIRASQGAAQTLGIPWHTTAVNLHTIGSGLLHDTRDGSTTDAGEAFAAPSPEWWPYRNQLLVTIAAAWALPRGFDQLLVGSVGPDGARHKDGTADFYTKLDELVAYQEGGIRVLAPAVAMTTTELIEASGVTDDVLGFAHSCHVAAYPCGMCPGCVKHDEVLAATGTLR